MGKNFCNILLVLAAITTCIVLSYSNRLWAADGDLDPSFDSDGKVNTDFGNNDSGDAIAIQNDQKIVVAGRAYATPTNPDFAVARYNPDGSLDTTFSGDGMVTTDFDGNTDYAFDVAIQADGKIVVAGFTVTLHAEKLAIARYNSDGSLDTSFSGNGKVLGSFLSGSGAYAVAIQNDQKIIVGGYVTGLDIYDFLVARYNPDGTLDNTFSGNGFVRTDFAGYQDDIYAIAIQPDNKIVAVGRTMGSQGNDFAIVRYNADGTLDLNFSNDGKATVDFAQSDSAL